MSSASISGTDRPPPDMPHATQVVPSLGLNGQPTTTPAPSEDNGGDTFPLAAIAILIIVLGIAGLVFAYKLYRWCYLRAQRAQAIEDFYGPDTRRSPGPGGFASLPSQISLGQGGGGFDSMGRRSMSGFAGGGGVRNRQMSWGGDSWGGGTMNGGKEGGDFSPPQQGSREASPGPYDASSRNSLAGFPSYSSRTSLGGPPPRRGIYSSSASGSQILSPTRTLSSFSSPYLGPSASSANSQQHFFPSGNRLAGAPHSIHSRIEVVPPSPLAPPPGQVIATDKSTLDFAPSSGIGRGNAIFGGGGAAVSATAAAAPTAVAPPIMASSSGSGASLGGNQNSDEWDLITGEEAQERLDPAFDATTPYSVAPSLSPIIPPSSSSSSSSSGMSLTDARPQPAAATATAVPSSSPYHDPSFAATTSSNAVAAAAPFAQNPDPSRPSPPRAGATRHPRLPSIDTGGAFVPPAVSRARAADVDDDDEVAGGPKSPLEKLQMQVERERKGLSLRQGLSQQGDEGYGH